MFVHFSFSPRKIEKISSKFRIDHNFIAISFAHMLLENLKIQYSIVSLYSFILVVN